MYGVTHSLTHLFDPLFARGEADDAVRAQRRLLDALPDGANAELRAGALYNLGCLYARLGRDDEALALLLEATALEPGLAEHARDDARIYARFGLGCRRERPQLRGVGEQRVEIERRAEHRDGAVVPTRPLLLGPVAVELDAVLVRIAEVDRLADAVVAGAVDRVARREQRAAAHRRAWRGRDSGSPYGRGPSSRAEAASRPSTATC